ncbi:MAG: hypothetical protein J6A01_00465 [Proteobacteria bacterium]|nr:hypothetical protein [Pseudomonadota bacterium]
MISCNTFLSINGQSPVECLPITGNNTVSLCKTGVTSRDSALASLQLDEHNELVVVRLTETPVTLERAGRKVALRINKPIRICEKDTLWMGVTSIEIVKSSFVISQSAPKSPLFQTARKVIAASAAVFSMATFAACEEEGCTSGEQQCKNNGVYICANNSWSLLEKCSSDQICIESSNTSAYCEMAVHPGEPIEECTPGEMKCDNKDVMKCEDGVWNKVQTCDGICIEESNISAVCDYRDLEGVLPYDPGLEDPPECEPDEMKCTNNNVFKCVNGVWILSEECNSNEVCFAESNTSAVCQLDALAGEMPIEECTPDEMKCEDNNVYKCDGGYWELDKKCKADEVCTSKSNTSAYCEVSNIDGGMQVMECTPDEMKCDNNKVMKCIDGVWVSENDCSKLDGICLEISNTSAICDMGPTSGVLPPQECEPDAMKCEDNNVYKCVDGFWKLEEECIKDAVCIEMSNTSAFCDMGPTTGVLPPQECEPNEMKCEDNMVMKCIDGMWEKSQACNSDEKCILKSNTSAVCEVEPLSGEPLPPDIPTPEPVQPPEDDS